MTLILSEKDVRPLLNMDEVVVAVEEAFRQEGLGNASNSMRTRSMGNGSVFSVMHANLAYLGRGGAKTYMWSPGGTRFTVILFDSATSLPLAVMGADFLGRFRTGAASGVATRHLYGRRSGNLAVMGAGKQALTQALAVRSVMSVGHTKVWSPTPARREEFARALTSEGMEASASDTPGSALQGTDVACCITSSDKPFISEGMLDSVAHVNLAGGNISRHAEITPQAVSLFGTVAVDDLPQAKVEYGDLIMAVEAGNLAWESVRELSSFVAGRAKADGTTLFKSGGAALEDVAVASLVYDKALKTGESYPNVELF